MAQGPATYRGPAEDDDFADPAPAAESARLSRAEEVDASERVMVAVRIRPHIAKADGDQRDKVVEGCQDVRQRVLAQTATGMRSFDYDYVFEEDSKQTEVFDAIGESLIKDVFEGYNCCVFAYGQTGSGKTHSMLGGEEVLKEACMSEMSGARGKLHPDLGLLPRMVAAILDECQQRQKENSSLVCKVQVSFLEVYNEKPRDLLNVPKGVSAKQVQQGIVTLPELKLVGESGSRGRRWYAPDQKHVTVLSLQAVLQLLQEGSEYRQRATTQMSDVSSRSHSLFTISLTQTHDQRSGALYRDKSCRMTIVDLAGSERQSKTFVADRHLKEAGSINMSLLHLGQCLSACASGGREVAMVRQSVLTKLLADIFGGNAKALMFAAVAPSSRNLQETLGTLQYAARAKLIKHNAKINAMQRQLEVRQLKEQVDQMSKMLAAASQKREQQNENDQKRIKMLEAEKRQLADRVAEARRRCELLRQDIQTLEKERAALLGGQVSHKDPQAPAATQEGPSAPPPTGRVSSARPTKARPAKVGRVDIAQPSARSGVPLETPGRVRVDLGDDVSSDEENSLRRSQLESVRTALTGIIPSKPGGPPTARSEAEGPFGTARRPSIYLPPPTLSDVRTLVGHNGHVFACAIDPSGARVLSASRDKSMRIWDAPSGSELRSFTQHNGFVLGCDFSPCGNLVASASDDSMVRVFDAKTGARRAMFRGHTDKAFCVRFSASGQYLFSTSSDRTIRVWDLQTQQKKCTLRGHIGTVYCVSGTDDESTLVSCAEDKTLMVWKWREDGEPICLRGHTEVVSSCRWHPDGVHVVSSSWDKTVKLWDVSQRISIRTFHGHSHLVHHAAFARGGAYIVSCSSDRTLRIWRTSDAKCVGVCVGHTNIVFYCAVRGDAIVSAANDELLKLWELPKDGL
eukprot:TRINITY_DN39959_c0_g1_i1.p1 TRINITY_DN39959_c0_g1~~TRINITY_DN39959_c0_g1_i1.p1  ORF type:complete len:944 (+),score=215.92 TRINITY_DN39959_c0_g1_i1:94-2832(+)